jgi:hypothetical protein
MVFLHSTLRGLAEAITVHQRRQAVLSSKPRERRDAGLRARELDFGDALRDAFRAHGGRRTRPRPSSRTAVRRRAPMATPR